MRASLGGLGTSVGRTKTSASVCNGAELRQNVSMRSPHEHNPEREVIRDALQRPLHDLRISLLDQCNFRCPYCMPEDEYHADFEFLRKSERLTYEEILKVARAAAALGVSKMRLTGGEPLLDKNIAGLITGLAEIAGVDDLALTTNAMLLAPMAQALADAGLHRVTISLDSLDGEVFRYMSGGRGDLAKVLEGLRAAEEAGLDPIKINVVVQRGVNDHTVLDLLEHFRGTGHIVRLIEFMDVGNINHWTRELVVPSAELLAKVHARWPLRPVAQQVAGETARRYEFLDGGGEIGFISSITEPFCGDCSRARVTAEGVFYSCLFSSAGTALRPLLRNGMDVDALQKTIESGWRRRNDRYSELRNGGVGPQSKVEMFRMGG